MIISSVIVDGLLKNVINTEQVQDVGFNNLINPSDRILAFIALVIIAPIAEEIIFRGWLYDKIKKYSGTTIAIVLVSVLFGALHGQWNVGITVGIMSAIMCIERELTGTIYAGILTHMIKNGFAFWLIYIVTGYF
jgi:membrane protease YdiL (CAAX protease family)